MSGTIPFGAGLIVEAYAYGETTVAPQVFRNVLTLVRHLQVIIASNGAVLVSVDGVDGSGKSCLASELARALGAEHVEVDRFLDHNRGGYLEFLRFDDLASCVRDLLSTSQSVVIEGVCMEYVLRRLRVNPTQRIYVKRLRSDGDWTEQELFDRRRTADEVIDQEEQATRQFGLVMGEPNREEWLPRLTREIIEYHHDCRPHETADYVYERIE